MGASLSTFFIGPTGQPFWRAVNRSTCPPLPTRTRTRTRGASSSRYVPSLCLCLTVSLPRPLLSPCAHHPVVLCCTGTCHLPLQLHGPPSLSSAISETTKPLQYLVYQINFSINPPLFDPSTSNPGHQAARVPCSSGAAVITQSTTTRSPLDIQNPHYRNQTCPLPICFVHRLIDDKDGRAKTDSPRQLIVRLELFDVIACTTTSQALRFTPGASPHNANSLYRAITATPSI